MADVAVLRDQPGVFGAVASDPTVSRLIDTLAADAGRALAVIDAARAAARDRVWSLAGDHAPNHTASVDDPIIVDLDATLLTAHSDKEQAAPTFKRGFGFHPLLAFVDHGAEGTGEPLSFLLRKGNAGSNAAADHIAVARAAFAQLPGHRPGRRPGRSVLVRTDGAGCTHAFIDWLMSQRVQYSVGFTLPDSFTAQLAVLDAADIWRPALDSDQQIRPDAVIADATGLLDLTAWPKGMRVIVRKEKPHPGAQLRITDVNGWRVTAFATNTPAAGGPHRSCAHLELPHRRRARCEDRIRICKDTGLTDLPLHDFDQNRIWLAIVALAVELTAWWQMLALDGPPRTPVGAETSTPTAVLDRRPRRRPWPHPPPAPRYRRPVGLAPARRDRPVQPAPRQADLTPGPSAPTTPQHRPGPWTRRPPARQRARCCTPDAESDLERRLHRRLAHDRRTHERSGLALVAFHRLNHLRG